MATWTDGPEYAPAQRPDAFAAPVAKPLDDAPRLVDLSAGAPLVPPSHFAQPSDPVPPLAALVPSMGPSRDPHQAFLVDSAAMTATAAAATAVVSGSAWGSAHSVAAIASPQWQPPGGQSWTADQPYASPYERPAPPGSFPAPGTPQWFGPGPEWAPPAPAVPATLGNALKAAGYGMLIVLAVGGLVPVMSLFFLAVAFALSALVSYRRRQIRRAFSICLGVALLSGAIPIATGQGMESVWDTMGLVALLGCWVMIVVALYLQYLALSAGERPEGTA